MIKSYLKTAFRFLLKNKSFSFINIFGLAAGTLCCLYILLYVQQQYSYDKHHRDAKDIYRVTTNLSLTGDVHHTAASSPPIAPAMQRDFPEVEDYTRIMKTEIVGAKQHLLRYKERAFYETGVLYVDSTFFNIFTYQFVEGRAQHALDAPYDVVLLKSTADKLFGREDAVGKMVNIDDAYGKHDFKVTGVIDESLGKSHIEGNLFIAMKSGRTGTAVAGITEWGGNNFLFSYVKLKRGANALALEKKLPAFLNKYGANRLKAIGMQKQLHLQRVADIHTTPGFELDLTQTTDPSFLLILVVIAVLIQVIACINFMNLSTARASRRAKEVGVRKVIGAGKYDLMKQFLGESFLLAFAGVVIALPLLYYVLPYLNDITNANIKLAYFADYHLWLMLGGLVLITGLLAGSYPAFYLANFEAIKVIKGNFTSRISAAGIRKSLVVFQFVLSIVMITGIIIIYSQLNFIKTKDLGFDKDQKLVFSFYTGDATQKMTALANDLKQLAEVKDVTKADSYFSQVSMNDLPMYTDGGDQAHAIDAQIITCDRYFVKTNGIKLTSGRDFMPGDSNKVLINQAFAKRLSLNTQTAPGAKLYSKFFGAGVTYTIAGIMKDFNYNSLHSDVNPFMLAYSNNPANFSNMTVSVKSSDYRRLLSAISAIWAKDMPSVPFQYAFLDDEVQKQYEGEITISHIINSFTSVAIVISCLGLFGLAAFSAEQRRKEIGIRKVLGSSVTGVVSLLSKDFLILVAISFVIATPVSWYFMSHWFLQGFAYKVPLSWWMFALAGVLAMAIALVTVSSQAIKAALMNPVNSLKAE